MDTDESAGIVGTTENVNTTQGSSSWVVWVLLWGGVTLVTFCYPLGQACVQQAGPGGGTHWSPNDADRAALVLRCLGGMAFAAGLIERLTSALTRERA